MHHEIERRRVDLSPALDLRRSWRDELDRILDYGMTPSVAELTKKVGPTLRRRGVVRASVFGSVARGEDRPDSDIDFLVEFEAGRTLFDLAGLRLDLEELLGRDVDVVTPNALHPKLRERILEDRVVIL